MQVTRSEVMKRRAIMPVKMEDAVPATAFGYSMAILWRSL
jgi:hypothetical protein